MNTSALAAAYFMSEKFPTIRGKMWYGTPGYERFLVTGYGPARFRDPIRVHTIGPFSAFTDEKTARVWHWARIA